MCKGIKRDFMAFRLAAFFVILNLVGSFGQPELGSVDSSNGPESQSNTCSTIDLNHSILVECKLSDCEGVNPKEAQIWPTNQEQVVHMYSSRSGDRFKLRQVENLNYIETIEQKWYDINTTFYVDTKEPRQQILGFGTSVDLIEPIVFHEDAESSSILRDLFAKGNSGIGLSILVVQVTNDDLINEKIPRLLNDIDSVLKNRSITSTKLILALIDNITEIEPLQILAKSLKSLSSLELTAVAIRRTQTVVGSYVLPSSQVKSIFSIDNVFVYARSLSEAIDLVDTLSPSKPPGLLIKSEPSKPYDIVNHLTQSGEPKTIVTIGSDTPYIEKFGDWQTAQHYAVEILKNFENGVNGFIETSSVVDLLAKQTRDSSIYSPRGNYKLHFRGPIFYALGHFSRHVVPGSKLLTSRVFTQPNMFAAHYQAFLTPQNQVVAIVLNDNEHLLPFRLAVDERIITNIHLPPKSFNTIVAQV